MHPNGRLWQEVKRAVDVTKRVWKGNGRGNSKRQAKRRKIFSQRTAYNVDGDDDDRVLLFNLTHTLPQPLFSVSRAVLIDLSDS